MTDENATPEEGGAKPTTEPKFITMEDFNRAASNRDKRFEAKMEKAFADFFAKLQPPPKDAEEPLTTEPSKPTTPTPDPTAAALKRLEKQLAEEKAKREESEKQRMASEAKSRRDEERSVITAALSEKGITGGKARAALALLHTEDQRVKRNEEGRIVFVDSEGAEIDFKQGFEEWLASDDGKSFQPPRNAQGAGTKPGNPPSNNGKPLTKQQIGMEMLKRAMGGTLGT